MNQQKWRVGIGYEFGNSRFPFRIGTSYGGYDEKSIAMGMGFVFVFLTILVISVTLMSKLIDRFQPAPVAAPAGRNPSARHRAWAGAASGSP